MTTTKGALWVTEKIGFSEVDARYEGGSEESVTEYAGFWRRAGAYLIDVILISLAVSILLFILQLFNLLDGLSKKEIENVEYVIQIVIAFIYFTSMESSLLQGTYGKHMLKMKVTDGYGERISFGRASIRHISKFLSAILLFIGFIMVAFTKKKQGLHDKIAETLVIMK
jgi:uncharacterized RDD family membrane protein YckC